jgi:hypothetical protein
MKARIQESIPHNHDPQEAFGLPIRGSDKCGRESTCLKFDKYMQLATEHSRLLTLRVPLNIDVGAS